VRDTFYDPKWEEGESDEGGSVFLVCGDVDVVVFVVLLEEMR
jgi:hypothetical protein